MNTYAILTTLYGKLFNRKYIPFWFFTPVRRLLRWLEFKLIPSYFQANSPEPVVKKTNERKVIVSLTSFPSRLNNLWLVVECMFRQTCPPDKIVLYLSKQEVKSFDDIPESLKCRQNCIFEIRMVDDAFRSHMKYYYAFKDFPNDYIITIDDDLFYPPTIIESLVTVSIMQPSAIVANETKRYIIENRQLLPYNKWPVVTNQNDNKQLFFLGSSAVCYPPKWMPKELFDSSVFSEICLYADDVWLNAMAQVAHTPIINTDFKYIIAEIKNESTVRLKNVNVDEGLNDKQLRDVISYCEKEFGVLPFSTSVN